MTPARILPALLLAAVLGGCAGAAPGPDRAARLAAGCNGCHGPDGRGSGAMPALRGLSATYTSARLNAWREAEDSSGRDHVMVRFARGLSEADIRALARWYEPESP